MPTRRGAGHGLTLPAAFPVRGRCGSSGRRRLTAADLGLGPKTAQESPPRRGVGGEAEVRARGRHVVVRSWSRMPGSVTLGRHLVPPGRGMRDHPPTGRSRPTGIPLEPCGIGNRRLLRSPGCRSSTGSSARSRRSSTGGRRKLGARASGRCSSVLLAGEHASCPPARLVDGSGPTTRPARPRTSSRATSRACARRSGRTRSRRAAPATSSASSRAPSTCSASSASRTRAASRSSDGRRDGGRRRARRGARPLARARARRPRRTSRSLRPARRAPRGAPAPRARAADRGGPRAAGATPMSWRDRDARRRASAARASARAADDGALPLGRQAEALDGYRAPARRSSTSSASSRARGCRSSSAAILRHDPALDDPRRGAGSAPRRDRSILVAALDADATRPARRARARRSP